MKSKFIKTLTKKKEDIIDSLILLSIIAFLLTFFKPSLLFSNTIISAGDTVGHYYGAYYMKKYLIPHLKLIGWSQDWFLGYPAFQFYFPLVFFFSGLLGYIIPLPISFKIATVLGTFLLPICTYFMFKFMNFKFPTPVIAASFVLIFLFLERVGPNQIYSMWGGNIPSTLAGEFSYSFSLSMMILFFGVLYKGLEEKKHIITTAIIFSLVVLSHAIVAIFAVIGSSFFLLSRNFKNNLKHLFKVYLLAFFICGFWVVPMLSKTSYTVPHVWGFPGRMQELIEQIIPVPLRGFYVLALGVGIIALFKHEKRPLFFLYLTIAAFLFFILSPTFNEFSIPGLKHLQLVKFLPFMYLSIILCIASGFFMLPENKNSWMIAIAILILCIYWVIKNETYIAYWIKWNYEGYEGKKLGYEYYQANEALSKFTSGRVAFEYDPQKYDSTLGSSRATETIPIFSGRPITEGAHFQSAFSGPYIYNAHCEYSNGCSCLFGPISHGCPRFNFDMGTKHMQLFNVKYFFVSSDKVKNILANRSDYQRVYGPNEFEIWELKTNDGHYVVVPDYEPIMIVSKNWRDLSYSWFEDEEKIDIPLVWEKNVKDSFRFAKTLIDPSIDEIPKIQLDNDNCEIKNEIIEEEKISFDTNCINKPHIIKVSYFPNWKVRGADKIYLVSPTFMLIYPNQKHVELYYGKTLADVVGLSLTYISIPLIIFWKKIESKIDGLYEKKKRK